MAENYNPALGGDALEFIESLLTPEEIEASHRRVAEIGKEIERRMTMAVKYKDFEGYEINWLRFNADLRALAEQLEDEGVEDKRHGGRYDYLRVKVLAACYELWNYSAGVIVENKDFWDKSCAEIEKELGVGDE